MEPLKFGYWAQDKIANDDIRPDHDRLNDETLQLGNTIHKNYQSNRMNPGMNPGTVDREMFPIDQGYILLTVIGYTNNSSILSISDHIHIRIWDVFTHPYLKII